jgi:2-polyprenyl-3-methyl-5-hydroxy-6-metoxy-1,4-benzoquinol methylase
MANVRFLSRIVAARFARQLKGCPNCGCSTGKLVGRKHLLLELRQCARCGLMFRWPKDTAVFAESFYQSDYCQGMTTEMPNSAKLEKLASSNFGGTEKDFSEKIELLKVLCPSGKVLDFGASWGYATFQLRRAGYDTYGFEISRPRALFGNRELGLKIYSNKHELENHRGTFDVVFASHVLEHLPVFAGVIEFLRSMLAPRGGLLIFVPNCGGSTARRQGVHWGPMCCERHPLAFDAKFFRTGLPDHGFRVAVFSDPYDVEGIATKVRAATARENCTDGDELMVWAQVDGLSIQRMPRVQERQESFRRAPQKPTGVT